MKLIHCGDIHLDSRMETHLTPEQARERGGELCATFARMVDYARREQVSAILIAGDLFDGERVTARTADFVLDTVAGAPEVEVFYLRGNHDGGGRAFAGRTMPENLKTFSTAWTRYDLGPVTVAGREWGGDPAAFWDGLQLERERMNIVILHGQISARAGEGLVCLPALRGKGIRYLALGHLHSYQRERLDEEGEYCYCGCLEGRGFDECGEKGFVLLETDGKRLRADFVPFARRTLWEVPVDLTGLTTVTQIGRAMESAAKGLSPDSLVKFTLTGEFEPDTQKDLPFLRQLMGQRFWFAAVADQSRLRLRAEDFAHDISLKGEFVRRVLASELSGEERDRVICLGLRALRGEEIVL